MRYFLALVLVVGTAACAATPPHGPTNAGEPRLLLLSPASLGRSLSLSQLVTGTFNGRTQRMRFEVDVTPDRLAVVALSPLGLTLFTLLQEGDNSVIVTQGPQKTGFDPRHILFDLHLTYWPRDALEAALVRHSMIVADSKEGTSRSVRHSDGRPIAEITYGAKGKRTRHIDIRHFDTPYRLRITAQHIKTDNAVR